MGKNFIYKTKNTRHHGDQNMAKLLGFELLGFERLGSALNSISKTFYPDICHNCNALTLPNDRGLCKECRYKLKLVLNPCKICGEELKDIASTASICGRCQREKRYYDKVIAPFHFCPPLDGMIHKMKISRKISNCVLIADLIYGQIILRQIEMPQCLIPTPTNPSKLRQRGFNQSTEIAKHLGKKLGITVKNDLIIKKCNTQRQSQLQFSQRQSNLKDAFILNRPIPHNHIAIIDDVVTTTATANELAKVAKQNGVKKVQIWACARSIKQQYK